MIINKAIIHKLDKSLNEPILNQFELEITEYTNKVFSKMIRSLIGNSKLRTCKYNNFNENIVRLATEEILFYNDKFKKNSQVLAHKLHKALGANDSNDFLVVLYTYKDKKYVAGICLDYSDSLITDIAVEQGETNIQLYQSNKAHKPTQKITKGFSCGVCGVNDEYHLFVLDQKSEKHEVSSSIVDYFIEGVKTDNSRYLTEKLINIVKGWITNQTVDDLALGKYLYMQFAYALDNYEFNYIEFANKFIEDDLKRESFILLMQEREMPVIFDLDRDFAKRKVNNNKIQLRSGIKINIKTDDYVDPARISFKKHENGNVDLIIKNIEFVEYL